MNKVLIIVLILGAVVLSQVIRNYVLTKNLKLIYDAAYVQKNIELFEVLIDSLQVQMSMSYFSRSLMKIKFYVFMDEENKALKEIKRVLKKKLNNKDLNAVTVSCYTYLLEKENEIVAEEILNRLEKAYSQSNNPEEAMLLFDSKLAFDIYINKDVSKIEGILEILENNIDEQTKAVYLYRLAKLYKYNNEKTKAIDCLKQAKKFTKASNDIRKIDSILKGNWEIL